MSGMAVLGALVAVILWGGSFAVTKVALAEVSVGTLVFTRAALGTALIGGWLVLRGGWKPLATAALGWVIVLSLLGNVLPQVLQGHALLRSTAASTAWLVALIPVVTALLARPILGERLENRAFGIAVAFAGTLLVVGGGMSPAEVIRMPSTRGDLLTLASVVSWSLYTIYGRSFVTRNSPVVVMAYLLVASLLVFTPPVIATGGWRELGDVSGTGWLAILYLGIGCSGLGFTLWLAALERIEASQLAVLIYLEPLVAQVLSRVMLGEPLRVTTLAGGAAILAGVYLVSRAPTVAAVPAVAEGEGT